MCPVVAAHVDVTPSAPQSPPRRRYKYQGSSRAPRLSKLHGPDYPRPLPCSRYTRPVRHRSQRHHCACVTDHAAQPWYQITRPPDHVDHRGDGPRGITELIRPAGDYPRSSSAGRHRAHTSPCPESPPRRSSLCIGGFPPRPHIVPPAAASFQPRTAERNRTRDVHGLHRCCHTTPSLPEATISLIESPDPPASPPPDDGVDLLRSSRPTTCKIIGMRCCRRRRAVLATFCNIPLPGLKTVAAAACPLGPGSVFKVDRDRQVRAGESARLTR